MSLRLSTREREALTGLARGACTPNALRSKGGHYSRLVAKGMATRTVKKTVFGALKHTYKITTAGRAWVTKQESKLLNAALRGVK